MPYDNANVEEKLSGRNQSEQSPNGLASNFNPGAFSFSGRARRSTYWGVTICLGLVTGLAAGILGAMAGAGTDVDPGVALFLGLCIGVPLWFWGMATQVRRCHDIGWSGWRILLFWLIGLIPFVGWIASSIFFVFLGFADSQPFTNQYGPDPKGRNLPCGQPQPLQPSPPPLTPKSQQASLGNQLRELKKLLDEGILTQEEFTSQKAKVLAGEGSFVATAEENTPEKPIVKTSAIKADTSVTMIPIPEKGYMICALPVTQAFWVSVMGENPSHFKGEDYPVDSVSWDDCQAFLDKLNMRPKVKESGITYRLPTAEEWEFACRADATGDYCLLSDGTEITTKTLGDVAWYASNSDGEPHPVGLKKPNAFGLYDMLGNVWEWTSTGVGSMKMFKGGAFNSSFALCKNSGLNNDNKGCNSDNRGFRLAADIVK